ncbi:alpha-amylase family glycosyl hydrolase [Aureimonas psammosilenae]|uniref:alpha-amylase family glycosyl hydrolase n=1 Tax=Aureimonas psammosilenae TaxID=2495496 RepID=UPI001260E68F|nr:alpha-amylase family glycosyl hydrolase [Aureimonas psammosilenae]
MGEIEWWRRGVIYQVYPRSFQDTDGDGTGDLNGIRHRLGYLDELGVDALWISPIYPSPMADFGYDVADYCDVDPLFGSLREFDALVEDAHRRGMRVILDFVPNHTSDRHPWFREARQGRKSRKRDWYIWRDPKADGSAPNNWLSNFGGSAWEYDEASGQYYYHAFLKEQPDLNWRNAEVRAAMYDALRFWLRRGVDGFRVDVLWHLVKDAAFTDNPPNPAWRKGMPEIDRLLQTHSTDQDEVHEVVAEMRSVLSEFGEDRLLIGEIYLPVERLVSYYGKAGEGAQLPFNFQLIHAAWNAPNLARLIETYERALPANGWPNWVLGNHDQKRIASRVGEPQARVAAMLLLTLRGTPTLYYGDEIGLTQVAIPPDGVRDPWERNEPGLGFGRDPQRTPMQWDASPNAGFTAGLPWLPLSEDRESRNAEAMRDDPSSLLALYRRLIALRRRWTALHLGAFRLLRGEGDVLVFERVHESERLLVALNLGHEPTSVDLGSFVGGTVLLSTRFGRPSERLGPVLELDPDEGVVVARGRTVAGGRDF